MEIGDAEFMDRIFACREPRLPAEWSAEVRWRPEGLKSQPVRVPSRSGSCCAARRAG